MNALARVVTTLLFLVPALLVTGCDALIPTRPTTTATQSDFMFEVLGYPTRNQGGQVLNLYFSYRYQEGLPDKDLPSYLLLRDDALKYLGAVDVKNNPYWETLNRALCAKLKKKYPIDAISCQLQVKGDTHSGVRYEPGYHSSIVTIGDIPPLQIPGPPR